MQRHATPIIRIMHTKSFSEKEEGKLRPDYFLKGSELVLWMRLKSNHIAMSFGEKVNFVA